MAIIATTMRTAGGAGGGSSAGFNASDVPYFLLVADPINDVTSYTTTLTATVEANLNTGPTQLNAADTNLFEEYGNGYVRYLGDNPALMYVVADFPILLATGTDDILTAIARNGLSMQRGKRVFKLSNSGGYKGMNIASLSKVQKYDVLNTRVTNLEASANVSVVGFYMSGLFGGYTTISQTAELFVNPTISGTTGFGGEVNCTLSELGGELTATASGAGASTFTASLSGLDGGVRGRLVVGAKRGGSGTGQAITSVSFGTIAAKTIDTTTEDFYVFDIDETGSSGTITFTVDPSASGGESLIITSLSFKEYT